MYCSERWRWYRYTTSTTALKTANIEAPTAINRVLVCCDNLFANTLPEESFKGGVADANFGESLDRVLVLVVLVLVVVVLVLVVVVLVLVVVVLVLVVVVLVLVVVVLVLVVVVLVLVVVVLVLVVVVLVLVVVVLVLVVVVLVHADCARV